MPNLLNKLNLYTFLWFVYYILCYLFWEYNAIRQILSTIILGISIYYFVLANLNYKLPKFLCGLNILLLMFSVYAFVLIIGNEHIYAGGSVVPNYDYLNAIYRALLPIYCFFYFSKNGYFTNKVVFCWILLFFLLGIAEFFGYQQRALLTALKIGSKQTEFTNNVGYYFLALIPTIPFLRKINLQYFAMAFCVFFLLLSVKRGAIIIGLLCFFLFIKNMVFENLSKKNTILFFLLVIFSSIFVHFQINDNPYFQKRIEETIAGNTSKRDDLYASFVNYFWNETTPSQFILGSGANATLKVSYNYAHNDWLEIAVNQGILGISVYLLYWFLFAINVFEYKKNNCYGLSLKMLFVIFFMKSLFSMSYNAVALPASFILGHCIAQERKNE